MVAKTSQGLILEWHISEPYTEFDWRKMNNNHPREQGVNFNDHIRKYFVRMRKDIKFLVLFTDGISMTWTLQFIKQHLYAVGIMITTNKNWNGPRCLRNFK